jgi:general secretion pathway protein D
MILKIVTCISALFFLASCASKPPVKAGPTITPRAPAAEAAKLPEAEVQKRPERPKKAEVRVEEGAEQEKFMVLNFVNADVETVISAIAGMLNLNYVLSPQVKGKVTIQSYKRFPLRDLNGIFQTILDMNGLAAVRDGSVYRIVPVESARQQPMDVAMGKDLGLSLDASFVTQLIPLEYVRAKDIVETIRNLLPRGVDLTIYEPSNLLIVTAPPSALQKFMKILDALDIPSMDRQAMKTFVYYVENSDAKKLAETLKSLYSTKKDEVSRPVTTMPTSPGAPPPSGQGQPAGPVTVAMGTVGGELEGEVVITTFEDINALVVKGTPRNYLVLLDTLKKLDIPTKQVIIEVLIAEVSLTDATQFGVEWLLKGTRRGADLLGGVISSKLPGTVSADIDPFTGNVLNILTTPPTGGDVSTAFAAVIKPDRYGVLVNAFSSLGKVNILATPHILATDNKEARIEIGDEIPIATGFQQQPATGGGTGFVAAGQIQYRTTGIILAVTPHITEKGMVKLKLSQEISSRGADISLAGITSPSFTKRKAETTGAVQSGSTLLIGGLMSEQKTSSREGIPFLYKIPVLGYLFGGTTDETRKSELLVMVTPHVINTPEEGEAFAAQFQNKVKSVKERLDEENRKTAKEKGK